MAQKKDESKFKFVLFYLIGTLILIPRGVYSQGSQNGSVDFRNSIYKEALQSHSYENDEQDSALIANTDSNTSLLKMTQKAISEKQIVLNIFLNPSTNQILIQYSSNQPNYTSIKWYNASDSLIYERTNLKANEKHEIRHIIKAADLHLVKGVYRLLIHNNEAIYLKKFVFY